MPPTSNALCACMRVHIPRKSLVVVALILESCEVSGSRKQPQIMSILCYATTYSTCPNKWVIPCSEYLFSFLFLSYVSDKLQRASLHNLSCYIYDIVLSFARHTCVHTCLHGRAQTNRAQRYKKKSTFAREMPKKVKIFLIFHEKRDLAGEYDVYSGVFEVCYPHICPIMRVRSIKRIRFHTFIILVNSKSLFFSRLT